MPDGARSWCLCGTPSLFLDDSLYWGNDRLRLLEHDLIQKQHAEKKINVLGLDHVVLRSSQPEQLCEFYQLALQCKLERKVANFLWQLRVGDSLLDIMAIDESSDHGQNMDHLCLRVGNYDEAKIIEHLRQLEIDVHVAGDIYGAQGFGPSLYFNDPQGNKIELKRAAG